MSNCLELRNGRVTFTHEELNLVALSKLLEEARPEHRDAYNDPVKYLVEWFLVTNTELMVGSHATINFGWGQSSHTFRDFKQLVNLVLKPLMKTSKHHTFWALDVENPQEGWFKWPVNFQAGIQ